MIYLDNASTTQPVKEVLDIYLEAQQSLFYNSESLHVGGEMVREALDASRKYIKQAFNTKKEVLFTNSGSHANQVAINTYLTQAPEGKVLVSPYEHPSILAALEPFRKQFEVIEMPLTHDGEIDLEQLQTLIDYDTVLVIAQHVNSETGYILPVEEIGTMAETFNIPFHVDGVQAVQKIKNINLQQFTSYAFAGHKFNGTKGTGILLMEHKSIRPLNAHYFHEEGIRNGTLDVPSILATTKALSLENGHDQLSKLYEYASKRAKASGFTILNYNHQAPHILGLLTPQFEGQYIMQSLASRNICISTGTACGHGLLLSDGLIQKINTTHHEPDQYIRMSFSKFSTVDEIEEAFIQIDKLLEGVVANEPS